MTMTNGHANGACAPETLVLPVAVSVEPQSLTANHLLEQLHVPFESDLVKWRVHETRRVHGRFQGFALPYADPRAYKDRLNLLLTPAGWSDQYAIVPIPTKVLVSCT